MNRHTKPHKCHMCQQGFALAKDCRRHTEKRQEGRKYRCGYPGCEYQTDRRDSLARHAAALHCEVIR